MYVLAGEPHRARGPLLRVLAREPENVHALINLSLVELQSGTPSAALTHLRKALRLRPSPQVRRLLAEAKAQVKGGR